MRYKGATPSGNFLDDYETSRAYAVEFLTACDGTAKVRPESRDKRKWATSANDKDDSGRKPAIVLLFELGRRSFACGKSGQKFERGHDGMREHRRASMREMQNAGLTFPGGVSSFAQTPQREAPTLKKVRRTL